jgi:Tfp pilus assembly protein PilZ
MESKIIANSIGIGGAIFIGLVLFWFIFVYLKKRMTSDPSKEGSSSSAKISWEEKRRHPRVAIDWWASIEKSGQNTQVQLRDISLGGAFVLCREPLALNENFQITLDLPDQASLQLNAEVVWSNANIPADEVVNRGMGIRFIQNEEKIRRQLQQAITTAFENSEA